MKNLIHILLLIGLLSSCVDYEDYQVDPNRISQPTPDLLLTKALVSAFGGSVSTSSALASRNLAYLDGVSSSQYYNWDRSSFGRYRDIEQVEQMMTIASESNQPFYEAVGLFLKSHNILQLTQVFGDVPYSEANKGEEGMVEAAYDKQKDIYLAVLTDLESAYNQFNGLSATANTSGDAIYDGDISKWIKLVNSYRLRVLLSLSHHDSDSDLGVRQKFASIVSLPLMESNDDSGVLVYHNISGNRYPLFDGNSIQTAYYMEKQFVETMKGLNDQRLPKIAEQTPNMNNLPVNDLSSYGGLLGSAPLDDNTAIAAAGDASRVNPRYYTDPTTEPAVLLSYSELQFILAEAAHRGWISGNSYDYYKKGIEASMNYYGVDQSDITAYLGQSELNYSNYESAIEAILTQKYLSMFLNTGWQIFYEQRRTGYPKFNVDGGATLNGGQVPKRWMYPLSEFTNNAQNVEAAVSSQFSNDNINGVMWLIN